MAIFRSSGLVPLLARTLPLRRSSHSARVFLLERLGSRIYCIVFYADPAMMIPVVLPAMALHNDLPVVRFVLEWSSVLFFLEHFLVPRFLLF